MSDENKPEDDDDKTLVTNIDEEPTEVITPAQVIPGSSTAPAPSLVDDDKTPVTEDADDEDTQPSIDLNLHLGANPIARERMDPRKIRSVAGTFKVYSLRGGKSEEFVFEGLRKKDYTEAEIKAGFEDYLVVKENHVPSFFEKLKLKIRAILANWLNKEK